jgi:toxin ParE1/3/4
MREVVTRPLAIADLEGIWLYTYEHWGEQQATRYLQRLNERIVELAREPERGRSMEAIRAGYRSARVGRHVLFYTFTDQVIGIERVLHDQMDVARHL